MDFAGANNGSIDVLQTVHPKRFNNEPVTNGQPPERASNTDVILQSDPSHDSAKSSNFDFQDFASPDGPPPPKVPAGWKAQWNEQYKEW
jgi:hypothetical protein